jgi:hypothetical protein
VGLGEVGVRLDHEGRQPQSGDQAAAAHLGGQRAQAARELRVALQPVAPGALVAVVELGGAETDPPALFPQSPQAGL